jgi:hypothetical protein
MVKSGSDRSSSSGPPTDPASRHVLRSADEYPGDEARGQNPIQTNEFSMRAGSGARLIPSEDDVANFDSASHAAAG